MACWSTHDRRRSNQCRACRAVPVCRLANPFAAAHTRGQRLDRSAMTSVKTSPLPDPTRLPSRSTFLRPTSCDACRVRGGTWSRPARARSAPLAYRHRASRYAPSPLRCRAVLANTVVSVRPPFTSAYLIDCGRFSGPDAASRLLQRVFNYDTRAHNPRALSSPTAGGCPADVAMHDALFTLPSPSSF